jgi:hypothetical protein
MGHRNPLVIYTLTSSLALLPAQGCSRQTSDTNSTPVQSCQPARPGVDPKLRLLMDGFVEYPDEAHFQGILVKARTSDDPLLGAVLDYEEMSKRMRPVDDQAVDMSSLLGRIRATPPSNYRLLAQIMVLHTDPWRRWTMAKFLGDFGGTEAVPELQMLLGDSNPDVREHARLAIDDINRRKGQ